VVLEATGWVVGVVVVGGVVVGGEDVDGGDDVGVDAGAPLSATGGRVVGAPVTLEDVVALLRAVAGLTGRRGASGVFAAAAGWLRAAGPDDVARPDDDPCTRGSCIAASATAATPLRASSVFRTRPWPGLKRDGAGAVIGVRASGGFPRFLPIDKGANHRQGGMQGALGGSHLQELGSPACGPRVGPATVRFRPAMPEISVTAVGPGLFAVQVSDGKAKTSHRVRVPDDLPERLGLVDAGGPDGAGLVRQSMEFLLEREPATSILKEFSLDDIARYFPGYYAELRTRISG
jgi:hypothetical protein